MVVPRHMAHVDRAASCMLDIGGTALDQCVRARASQKMDHRCPSVSEISDAVGHHGSAGRIAIARDRGIGRRWVHIHLWSHASRRVSATSAACIIEIARAALVAFIMLIDGDSRGCGVSRPAQVQLAALGGAHYNSPVAVTLRRSQQHDPSRLFELVGVSQECIQNRRDYGIASIQFEVESPVMKLHGTRSWSLWLGSLSGENT